jgi:hypothetical protein
MLRSRRFLTIRTVRNPIDHEPFDGIFSSYGKVTLPATIPRKQKITSGNICLASILYYQRTSTLAPSVDALIDCCVHTAWPASRSVTSPGIRFRIFVLKNWESDPSIPWNIGLHRHVLMSVEYRDVKLPYYPALLVGV